MEKQSFREKRIKNITQLYYSRKDVQEAIFQFSKNREIAPRYGEENFGKRPDSFQYKGDVFELVKRGATSFHCSQELWSQPLNLTTGMNQEQLNELRIGWDLVIDIDCKWFDYSKKAAQAIIKALEFRKVKNFGVKFSGSKGFHIIVPWKAFPEQINNIKTSDMFPEWPRIMTNYLKELSRPILEKSVKEDKTDFTKVSGFTGIRCENCKNLAVKNYQITLQCRNHKIPHIETFISPSKEYSKRKCPNCNKTMREENEKEFYNCNNCNINSIKNPENFHEKISTDIFKLLGLDLILVSPRHLFRMPYSLHEKTALASVVLLPDELPGFQPKNADPLKAEIRNFLPNSEEGEATELLREALDWYKSKHPEEQTAEIKDREFKPIKLSVIKEENFPPTIKKILQGIKGDGRKRALFVLMNFLRSIGTEKEELEKILYSWNEKNEVPLKKGYIKAQLASSYKRKPVPPPNYDKDYYKAIGIIPTEEELRYKNPTNYMVKKSFQNQKKKSEKTFRKSKKKNTRKKN